MNSYNEAGKVNICEERNHIKLECKDAIKLALRILYELVPFDELENMSAHQKLMLATLNKKVNK